MSKTPLMEKLLVNWDLTENKEWNYVYINSINNVRNKFFYLKWMVILFLCNLLGMKF